MITFTFNVLDHFYYKQYVYIMENELISDLKN